MMRIRSKVSGYVFLQLRSQPSYRSPLRRKLASQYPHDTEKKSRFGMYALGTVVLTGGGVVLYAWANDMGPNEALSALTKGVSSISTMVGLGPDATNEQKAVQTPSAPAVKEKPVKEKSGKSEKQLPILRPVMSIENLQEDEKIISEIALSMSKSYQNITKLMKDYVTLVAEIVDKSADRLNPNLSSLITSRTEKVSQALAQEEANIKKCQEKINELRMKIRDSKLEGAKDLIELSKRKIEQSIAAIKDSSSQFTEDRQLRQLTDQTWEKLEKTRAAFLDELHHLFPNLDIVKKVLALEPSEIDMFLIYSYMQVKMYTNKINNIESNQKNRIRRALSSVTNSLEDEERIGNMVSDEVTSLKKEMDKEMQKKVDELKKECESEITRQLALATEAHLMTVEDLQLQEEAKIVQKHAVHMSEIIKNVKNNNAKSIKEMTDQLGEVEALVKSRADTDYGAHRAQMLWAACHSLLRSLRRLQPLKNYEDKVVPIQEAINVISSTSLETDQLAANVLRGVSQEARNNGVFTEEALIERFNKVEKVSMGVALVPEKGGSLPLFLLSWIQSYFITSVNDFTHSSEKLNQAVSPKMDTFDILHEARFWIERGDLLQALKFMNLLQGFSRRVAEDWMKETRIHLETVQAAEALMAHAVSMGML